MRAAICLLLLVLSGVALAADALPPRPADYVEDAAGILNPPTRVDLARKLAQFERDTSNQVLVAIFSAVPGDFAMEDFTQRTVEAWGVGQRAKDNGAVLFIFPQDRKMRIEVGYGLEGAIPDATAKSILDTVIRPAFRDGDFNGGVSRGVDAILQAARGEYKGTGRTNAESNSDDASTPGAMFVGIFIAVIALLMLFSMARQIAQVYTGRGRRRHGGFWSSGDWGGGGGSRSGGGGGGFSGGGGGFSGGGGGFGGGGASGGW